MRPLPLLGMLFSALLALVLVPREASAIGWGVRLGLHTSNVTGGNFESSFKFGFQGGVSVDMPVGPVVLAPEALFVSAGYKYSVSDTDYRATLSSAVAELLVRVGIPQVQGVHVTAGPRLAYLLAGSVESPQGDVFNVDAYNRFSYGLTVGAGYSHMGRYLVQLRYSRDLSNISAVSEDAIANQIIALVGGLRF